MYTFASKMSPSLLTQWLQYQEQHGRLTFSLAELREALPGMSAQALKTALYRSCINKRICPVWQGFYVILPPEYRPMGTVPPCEYIEKLMQHLGKPYCVALLNAAAYHGAAHQRPMNFTVMTAEPKPRYKVSPTSRIDFITKREFANGIPPEFTTRIKTQFGSMLVTTPEFTALSLLQYTRLSGGLSHVLTVMEELADACRFDTLPDSALQFIPLTCFQRLGFMLHRLLGLPEHAAHLERLIQRSGRPMRKTPLDPLSPDAAGDYDPKWKILVNSHPENNLDD